MAVLLYDIVIRAYFFAIKLSAFFNDKAKKWVAGRDGIFEKLVCEISAKRRPDQPLVWMHCASLGEFEQGRPILDALRAKWPDRYFVLSFFSPSGFELRKNYPQADYVFYLPLDTRQHARQLISLLRPSMAIFVKYEFWFHHLTTLRDANTPTYLIAAGFRPGQPFFRWYGGLHREMLGCFTKIMVQDEAAAKLLQSIGRANAFVCGDPRIDRVLAIAAEKRAFLLVEKFCGDTPVMVCGSTWPADETLIRGMLDEERFANWKLVIAPHDISPKRLEQVEQNFSKCLIVRYSKLEENPHGSDSRILLVDNIGMLAWLYQYGTVAYIGGGFGAGIHNILEPMAFGSPVFFGPRHGKFPEARQAIAAGCGSAVTSTAALIAGLAEFFAEGKYATARKAANRLMQEKAGATELIMREL